MNKHRCFLALLPQPQLHRQLFDCSVQLQSSYAHLDVRWTRAEQFHLTLNFLGNLSNEQIEKLDRRLSSHKAEKNAAIRAQINRVSLFPNPDNPRVIAALIDSNEELQNLRVRCHLPEQKPVGEFRPHITLARCRNARRLPDFNPYPVNFELQARELHLIESELTQRGPVYSVIGSYPV
ncbi:MAG: RNA 2',3'-cyclic phosphodiesterase [Gammaproteobacteria bacterium]|nr:RNA 2',3'-cyclic phosphodiesterase [Gammaproteobacteria bacterium]